MRVECTKPKNCWDCFNTSRLCDWNKESVYCEINTQGNFDRTCPTETYAEAKNVCEKQTDCRACVTAVDGTLCGWIDESRCSVLAQPEYDQVTCEHMVIGNCRIIREYGKCANTCLKCVYDERSWQVDREFLEIKGTCNPTKQCVFDSTADPFERVCYSTEDSCSNWDKWKKARNVCKRVHDCNSCLNADPLCGWFKLGSYPYPGYGYCDWTLDKRDTKCSPPPKGGKKAQNASQQQAIYSVAAEYADTTDSKACSEITNIATFVCILLATLRVQM